MCCAVPGLSIHTAAAAQAAAAIWVPICVGQRTPRCVPKPARCFLTREPSEHYTIIPSTYTVAQSMHCSCQLSMAREGQTKKKQKPRQYQAHHSSLCNVLTTSSKTSTSKKATGPTLHLWLFLPANSIAGCKGKLHLEQAATHITERVANKCSRACSAAVPGKHSRCLRTGGDTDNPQQKPSNRSQAISKHNFLTRLRRLRLMAGRGPV